MRSHSLQASSSPVSSAEARAGAVGWLWTVPGAVLERGGRRRADMFVCAAGCRYNLQPPFLSELGVGESLAVSTSQQLAMAMACWVSSLLECRRVEQLWPLRLPCSHCSALNGLRCSFAWPPRVLPSLHHALRPLLARPVLQASTPCTATASWAPTRASAQPLTLSLVSLNCWQRDTQRQGQSRRNTSPRHAQGRLLAAASGCPALPHPACLSQMPSASFGPRCTCSLRAAGAPEAAGDVLPLGGPRWQGREEVRGGMWCAYPAQDRATVTAHGQPCMAGVVCTPVCRGTRPRIQLQSLRNVSHAGWLAWPVARWDLPDRSYLLCHWPACIA